LTTTRRIDPKHLYIGIEVAESFFVATAYTTSIVYRVMSGHLNALQLILLGTILELSYFIVQLPTGILADIVSRRLCVIASVRATALSATDMFDSGGQITGGPVIGAIGVLATIRIALLAGAAALAPAAALLVAATRRVRIRAGAAGRPGTDQAAGVT
jgi:MFS transporter, DHA3 family, tetracycline resistance protein